MNTSLDMTYLGYLGFLGTNTKSSPLLAHMVAASTFERALRRGLRRQLWSKLTGTGRSSTLQTLEHQPVIREATRSNRITSVPLDQIVGSESRSEDFDSYFNPLKIHNRERWIGIAIAYRSGVALPPVELVQEGDHFYVRDGHHRISVARTLGQLDIEARIVN